MIRRGFELLDKAPKALRASVASLAVRLGGMACTLALGVILARIWGPTGYGIYGLVISLSALAMNLVLLGAPQLAVREFAIGSAIGSWSEVRRLARSFQLAALLASLALVALALGVVATGRTVLSVTPSYLLIGAAMTLFLGQSALLSSSLRGVGEMSKGQFMDILGRPAAVLVATISLLAAQGGLSIGQALWIQLGAALAGAAICQAWFRRATVHPASSTETLLHRWLPVAIPLGLIDILRTLDGNYALIMLGWFAPGDELGIFRVALACSGLINMPISIIHIVLAPDMSRLRHAGDQEELQAVLDRVSKSMTAISAAIAIALLLIGKPLLIFAFGAQYAGAWLPLVTIALAQVNFSLFGMGPILLAMAGQERRLTWIYLGAVCAGIAAAALLTGRFGGTGAAFAQMVSLTAIGALSDCVAARQLGVHSSFIRWPWPGAKPIRAAG